MIQKYAILSDIHGNRWALESVLNDIKNHGIEIIINLGDIFYGPLDPKGTASLLKDIDIITIKGNEDRIIYEDSKSQSDNFTLQYVLDQLDATQINWLKSLPVEKYLFDDFYLCHGSPQNDTKYLLEDVSRGYPQLKSNSQIASSLKDIKSSIILCGHSHIPGVVELPDDRIVINPGSVGLQAYTDDSPVEHKMETGNPLACYTILIKNNDERIIENIKVSYDWESAAKMALVNNREDWTKYIKTGRV